MTISREQAVLLAARFANANGYRVVASFDGLVWCDEPLPIKLEAARWNDGSWSVLFEYMLAPGVESECPGDICVVVPATGGPCSFYPML